jgi:hypothetical protein
MLRYPFDPYLAVGADGLWWLSTWSTVRKFRLPEPLIRYRVRGHSLSTTTPSKRRKLALSKLGGLPMARPLLLAATYALHRLCRRLDYVPAKSWQVPETSAIDSRS